MSIFEEKQTGIYQRLYDLTFSYHIASHHLGIFVILVDEVSDADLQFSETRFLFQSNAQDLYISGLLDTPSCIGEGGVLFYRIWNLHVKYFCEMDS